ncbi:MAG: hypothetical protein AW07_02480 [Candidatus Accumulibacter sp. SK-11]|nr:MAG: hypothetical protein AW07_02480 [Candidatus Accumulibacter sp. SK-11]
MPAGPEQRPHPRDVRHVQSQTPAPGCQPADQGIGGTRRAELAAHLAKPLAAQLQPPVDLPAAGLQAQAPLLEAERQRADRDIAALAPQPQAAARQPRARRRARRAAAVAQIPLATDAQRLALDPQRCCRGSENFRELGERRHQRQRAQAAGGLPGAAVVAHALQPRRPVGAGELAGTGAAAAGSDLHGHCRSQTNEGRPSPAGRRQAELLQRSDPDRCRAVRLQTALKQQFDGTLTGKREAAMQPMPAANTVGVELQRSQRGLAAGKIDGRQSQPAADGTMVAGSEPAIEIESAHLAEARQRQSRRLQAR